MRSKRFLIVGLLLGSVMLLGTGSCQGLDLHAFIDLHQAGVDKYIGEFTPTPLLLKSLYIDETFDYFEEQASFDQSLMRTQMFDFMRDNVSKAQFYGALEQAGYGIMGYELAKIA